MDQPDHGEALPPIGVLNLPAEVRAEASEHIGEVHTVSTLGGLSGRTVAAAHGSRATVVVKGPATSTEVAVASELLPQLADVGIRTARTTVVPTAGAGAWLVMEHLPDALPRSRWGADPAVLDVLRRLHAIPTEHLAHMTDRYSPVWDDTLTTRAATALKASGALERRMQQLAQRAQHLFAPTAVVSADPNPLNWRVDSGGTPVLIDWERLTIAHPAIDLGILMPGLGDLDLAQEMAARYDSPMVSTDDVRRAKAWSLVEFAADAPPGSDAARVVHDLRDGILDRLAAIPL